MDKGLTTRAMEPSDAAVVAALSGELGYPRTEKEIACWVSRSTDAWLRQTAFVACQIEHVVGWVEVSIVEHLQSPAHGLIGGLVVQEGKRGLGIGRLLRERAEDWAWQQGVEQVVVTSRSTRLEAHRFYLRDGYSRVKTSEVFVRARPR